MSEYIIIISIVAFCGIMLFFNQLVSAGQVLVKWSGCIICDDDERLHSEEEHAEHAPATDPERRNPFENDADHGDDHAPASPDTGDTPETTNGGGEPVEVANNTTGNDNDPGGWNWNGVNNTGWSFWWDGVFGGLWSMFV